MKENEALKEIGKGFINLGNIAGALSFVNIFLQKKFSYLELGLVAYTVVMLYSYKKEYIMTNLLITFSILVTAAFIWSLTLGKKTSHNNHK